MGAVRARFRVELRHRARSLLALSLVVGLAGGLVVALVAGASRTESAYDRFLERSAPSDVLIQTSSGLLGPGVDPASVARLPQVRRAPSGVLLFTGATTPSGRRLRLGELVASATSDGEFGRSVDRETVIEGRLADDRHADEVVLGTETAKSIGAHAGDTMELVLPKNADFMAGVVQFASQLEELASGGGVRNPFDVGQVLAGALRLRVKVVGVITAPVEVPPLAGTLSGLVRLTPAFYDKYAADLASSGFMVVRLRPGASIEAFKTAVEGLDGGQDALFLTSEPTQTAAVNRSLSLQAAGLRIIAALVLLVALLVLGQALARLTVSESDDFPTLRALGMTRRELFLIGVARSVTIAVPAAVVCALLAIGLSTFWPTGVAGTIETTPGVTVDASTIGIGCVLLLLVVPLLAAWPAWRAAAAASRALPPPRRVSRVARLLGRGSRPFAARLGVRLALDPGRGRRAVPVRTAIAVGVVAIAATAVAVGFSSSLNRLRDTPRLYGWSWDAQLGATGLPDVSIPLVAGLEANDSVDEIAVGAVVNVSINGTRVDALAVDPVRGRIDPILVDGRAPRSDREIALGAETMRDLGVAIGDLVGVGLGETSADLRIVGQAVFPNLGDAAQLGRGAAMSYRAVQALGASPPKSIVLVRFAQGAAPPAARARLERAISPYPVLGPSRPDDLVSLGNLDRLAVALGLVLAALAAATLTHTLITSVRRRATDLAVLKALGVTRRQVGAVIGWQAVTLLAVALAIGLPLGLALSRVGWRVLADRLGVPAEPTADVAALAILALVVVALGLVAASGPAIAAARTPPVRVLREE